MNATAEQIVAVEREADLDLACETLYRFLAATLTDPRFETWNLAVDARSLELVGEAAQFLRAEFESAVIPLGFGELPADELEAASLAAFAGDRETVAGEFGKLFGLVNSRECPPYETEFQPNEDPFFRSQQMADIAGFYRAFGLELGSPARERPDHVALELEFAAFLLMRKRLAAAEDSQESNERVAVCQAAYHNFLRDHLSWWLPSFSLALRRKAEKGFYEIVGRLIAALIPLVRHRLDIAPFAKALEARPTEESEDCSGCLAASMK